MTTIATDGVTIAADGRRTVGSERIEDNASKLAVRDGRIFAIAGEWAIFPAAIDWFLRGAMPDAVPKSNDANGGWSLHVIDMPLPQCQPRLTRVSSNAPYPEQYPFPQAFGSGCSYAQAALLCGQTPKQAVAIAAQLDVFTGGVITELNIARTIAEGREVRA